LEEFLLLYKSFPFDDKCARAYGEIRAKLAQVGLPIGPNDLFIAATAVAFGAILVTHNTREFSRIEGLPCEDWEAT
jgi:tRNA(fMet)-specific endonuclease VapC